MDTEPTRPVEPPTENLSEPATQQFPQPPTQEIPVAEGPPRRNPLAEAGAALAEVGRIIANYAVYSVKAALAWAGAWRRLARLRQEIKDEHKRRVELLTALGDAAFREDGGEVAALRQRIGELDHRIGQLERERGQTLADTRARVERGRAPRPGGKQAVAVDEPDG